MTVKLPDLADYLKIDGTRAMTGTLLPNVTDTLDIGTELLRFNYIRTNRLSATEFTRALAGSKMTFQPNWNKGYMDFKIYNGSAWVTVMTIGLINTFGDRVDIPRLGAVTCLPWVGGGDMDVRVDNDGLLYAV